MTLDEKRARIRKDTTMKPNMISTTKTGAMWRKEHLVIFGYFKKYEFSVLLWNKIVLNSLHT